MPTNPDQRVSLERIHQAIEAAVRVNPAEVTSDDVHRELQEVEQEIDWNMAGGAFNTLRQRGFLKNVGQRTSQWPGMKNRKITIYRPTPSFLSKLGLAPPVTVDSHPTSAVLKLVYNHAQRQGFICDLEDIVNFYLCLRAKPFVILSGISGTGKTKLPRLFAEAVGANLKHIAVKPNWSDNSDLMGYFSVAIGDFVPGPLTLMIEECQKAPGKVFFVTLDEMNLAHVEYYLSDILSVMETRTRRGDGVVSSEPIPLELPLEVAAPRPEAATRWAELRKLRLPWNLFMVGTVNVDETTHPFSRKVLDRASTIDFSDVELGSFGAQQSGIEAPAVPLPTPREFLLDRPLSIQEIYSSDAPFFDGIAGLLEELNNYLRDADMHFAYRVRDEVCLYMWSWKSLGLAELLPENDAFDLCLLQKVLSRCQGSSESARAVLQRVFFFACGVPVDDSPLEPDRLDARVPPGDRRYRRTAEKTIRMLRRYRDGGFFSYWSS